MARRKLDPPTDNEARDTIGALVRVIRKRREMTLEQLSKQTGISVSSLSRIENTQLGLTIEKVEILASALGVSPEILVSRNRPGQGRLSAGRSSPQKAGSVRFMVDRARHRKASLDRELSIEYLFDHSAQRSLECMHLTLQAISVWDSEFVRHPGEKIIYVINGEAVIYCEKQSPLVLEAGDSLYMDANVWHSIVAVNERPAELLVTYYHGPSTTEGAFETQIFSPEHWAALHAP